MKKSVYYLLVLFSINTSLYSQSGWYQQQSGVNVSLNSIYFVNSNTGWICGDSGKILKSSNGGSNWILQNSPTQYPLLSVFFLNENTGWSAGGTVDNPFVNRMIVLKTTNGGGVWSTAYYSNSAYSCFKAIHFTDELHGFVVEEGTSGFVGVGGLWQSSDGGYNWIPHPQVPASSDIQFADANTGWVLGQYWDDTGLDTAYISKSMNGGNTWNRIYQKSMAIFSSLHFINNNTGWVAGFDNENFANENIILKTTNAGVNWDKYNFGPTVSLDHIFFTDVDNGWGCSGRIYRTTNSGMNWQLQLDYIGNFYNSIFFTDSLTGWVAGTNGAILKTGGLTSINSSDEIVANDFSLSQNYPNPFNPKTIINYQLPITNYVSVKVFDALGKEVATLVNENQNPGTYQIEFDGSNLSSGIYFYKIIAGDFSEVKKMTLLK